MIMEENMIVIRDCQNFCFNSNWSKYADEIQFIIKSDESLAENKIKNEIQQLLLKYKHGNDIHEHGKQHND